MSVMIYYRPNHHFLLDAGSSMFSSSISFFSCAYSQRKVKPLAFTVIIRTIVSADDSNAFNQISFNEVYTWELTLLEPSKFWEDVSVPH